MAANPQCKGEKKAESGRVKKSLKRDKKKEFQNRRRRVWEKQKKTEGGNGPLLSASRGRRKGVRGYMGGGMRNMERVDKSKKGANLGVNRQYKNKVGEKNKVPTI